MRKNHKKTSHHTKHIKGAVTSEQKQTTFLGLNGYTAFRYTNLALKYGTILLKKNEKPVFLLNVTAP